MAVAAHGAASRWATTRAISCWIAWREAAPVDRRQIDKVNTQQDHDLRLVTLGRLPLLSVRGEPEESCATRCGKLALHAVLAFATRLPLLWQRVTVVW